MIDPGLPDEWEAAVVEATSLFDQGDLVARPPLFYAGRPSIGVWSITQVMADEVDIDEDIVIELDPEDRPPYGVITSQGCDVADVSRKPWIQVAPVFPFADYATDGKWAAELKRQSVPHLVILDPPTLEGIWVADLRIEMPLEKSWLVGKEPISGFEDEAGRREFAQRLAGRLERPALPDAVHAAVVRPLRRWLDKRGPTVRDEMAGSAIEFRLLTQPDNGTTACRLLVIARRGEVPASVAESLEKWWMGRIEQQPAGDVALLACRFGTSDEITMRDYVASVLIDDRFLEPAQDAVA